MSRRKKECFDDDSFWRDLFPFMFTKERLAAADEHVLEGDPYGIDAQRLVSVARRAPARSRQRG